MTPSQRKSTTLLITRLHPPRRERGVISRDIVPGALIQMRGKRLLIARAPAGYGKSLFLGQLHDQLVETNDAVGWISTAALDGSARELALYILATLQRACNSEVPSEIEWLFYRNENIDSGGLSTALCNAMQRIRINFTLFLDDLHMLDGTSAMRLLATLVRDAPEQVRFAVASRVQPAFDLARLRAHGQLLEFGVEQLRFSSSESKRFLAADHADPLSSELADLVYERTEGWAAGLQLVVLAAERGEHMTDWVNQHFSGANRTVRDYLEKDVLATLDSSVQEFLVKTAVFREFTAELCDELLERRNSSEVISKLENAGLFIFSLDTSGDWFRYHHLFREFLERNLKASYPHSQIELHKKAACSFRVRGLSSEALFHSCAAGDFNHAAAVLNDTCEESFYQGRLWSLADWIRRIPEPLLAMYPRMQLARVWSLTLELKFNDADDLLQRTARHIDDSVANNGVTVNEALQLNRLVLHRKMMLAQFRDDLPETERLCNKLLIDFPNDEEPFLRGSLDASLANAHQELFKLDSLDRLDKSAREYFGRTGKSYPLVFHESIMGSGWLQRGGSEQAAQCYQNAINIATIIAGAQSSLVAMPALLLARLQLERCEFASARLVFDEYLPLAGGVGFVDQLIAGFVGRSRLAAIEENFSLADDLLARGESAAASGSFNRLHWHVVAERVRQMIQRHDLKGASKIAARAQLPIDPIDLRPHDGVTSQLEMMALTWLRLNLTNSSERQVDDLIRRWVNFAERRGCTRCELRMRLIGVSAKLSNGETKAAMRMLVEATTKAVSSGFALMFLEEGDFLRAAVARLLGEEEDALSAVALAKSFAARLRRRPESSKMLEDIIEREMDSHSVPLEATTLTQREIEIIGRVANGSSNKEIGTQLELTEGTVKWYLQQIYRKLGANRRVEAVQLARAVGLLR